MSAMSNEKRKRKREKEVKKWTDDDVKKVLNYMQVHRNIEKPSARLYYKKLLEETKIDATWNMVKCKVRHLKGTLQKAEGDGETMKDNMIKIWPYYEQLSDIFSSEKEIVRHLKGTQQKPDAWRNSTCAGVEEIGSETTMKNKMIEICPDIFSSKKEVEVVLMDSWCDELEYSRLDVSDSEEETQVSDEPGISAADVKVKCRAQNNCFDMLVTMEAQRANFREKQLQLEKEKFEWSKEIEKKKMENDFEIQKLELEQIERLKMYEIEMKYKNNK